MSDLDKDFDDTVAKINAKLKEAAAAVEEANAMATGLGLPSLIYTQFTREDMLYQRRYDANGDYIPYNPDDDSDDEIDEKCEELEAKLSKIDVSDLESALGGGGWSTSASYC